MSAEIEQHFLEDLEHSDEIKLDTFRQRGAWQRVKENVCYAFWRIL